MATDVAPEPREASRPILPDLRSMVRYVIGNAGALVVGLVAAYIALTVSHTADPSTINLRTVDFMEYYSASQMILHGHGGAIYSWTAIGHEETRLVQPFHGVFGVIAYFYPPYFVLALVPLALLPYTLSYLIWFVIDCALLAACTYLFEQYIGLRGGKAAAFRFIAFSLLPAFMALGLGQVSILLLAALTAAFFALRAGRDDLAGIALACGAIKPFYVFPLFLVLVLYGRWRGVATAVATGVVLLVVPVPFLGVGTYGSFVRMLQQVTVWQGRTSEHPLWYHGVPIAPSTYAAQWNHSLAGFFGLLLPAQRAEFLVVACSVLLFIGLAYICLTCRTVDVAFALGVPVGLLISPHTLAYDLTLLLLPVAVILRYRRLAPRLTTLFLVLGYLAMTVGYKLAFFVPVQITVLGTAATAVWLFVLARHVRQGLEPATPVRRAAVSA